VNYTQCNFRILEICLSPRQPQKLVEG